MVELKKIRTMDGSITFHNSDVDEFYHSKSGAMEESLKKYVEPCKVKELAKTGRIKILDVCFGLGYNSAVAVDVALEANPNCEIEIVGLEKDINILKKIKEVFPAINSYHIFQDLKKECSLFLVSKPNVQIKVLIGDAKQTIKDVEDDFDCVFFDPFSPKKQPDLWTKEFFVNIKKVMKPTGILATYSCARIVRDNLKSAGFKVIDGPVVGRRAPSTLAFLGVQK